MIARHADSRDEATHRYISHIRWGRGSFGDGYRYVVADSDEDAFLFVQTNSSITSREDVKSYPSNSENFK